MTAGLDFEGLAINPSFATYVNILQELGLTPYSEIPLEQIKLNDETRQRLITALKFLLDANLRHLIWSNQLDANVQKMKFAVITELSKS